MLLIIHCCFVVFFLLLAFVFARGKGAFLIAGYNTMPAVKKAQIDEKKLCRRMSRLMLALAGSWSLLALSEIFHTMLLLWIGLALFALSIVVGLIVINRR